MFIIRFLAVVSLGYFFGLIFEKTTLPWALWDKRVGIQFHHSLLGLVFIILAFFFTSFSIELFAFGLGIIIQHSLGKDGFVFIQKWPKEK